LDFANHPYLCKGLEITTLAVLLGLAAVFYAGMTFKQTLYEDWCMDNGGLIKQGVYDNCVHPLGDFLNPALALLGQGLKKSPIGQKLDFANHPYLCKGLE
jgi:hypothetical protein